MVERKYYVMAAETAKGGIFLLYFFEDGVRFSPGRVDRIVLAPRSLSRHR